MRKVARSDNIDKIVLLFLQEIYALEGFLKYKRFFMPRVFIFGDSTAAAKEEKARPETGWGECFSPYLAPGWILDNRAVNGRSTKQVLANGEFFNALSLASFGDVALIQYGHNESKSDEERHTEPWTSFMDNLIYMAQCLVQKGVSVYFLTPIARRKFIDGMPVDTHGDYPKAMKDVASSLNIPVIDMTEKTMELLRAEGDEGSMKFFMHFPAGVYPNYPLGDEDDTHLRPLGAQTVASMVNDSLKKYSPSFLRMNG